MASPPSAKAEHQEICKRLERLLDAVISPAFIAQRDTTLYVAGAEGPRPDVFVIRKDRWNPARRSALGYPEDVPELVIEVRSASNSDPELEQKRSIYCSDARCLASGWSAHKRKLSASSRQRSRHDYCQRSLLNCLLKSAAPFR